MNQSPLVVGMLLYPGFTLLDLVGPLTVISIHAKLHLEPVASDSGVAMVPTTLLRDCPGKLDVLFVSGSLLLGAAGLMQGYQARVVTDRNRISGGGVTAGIDFALTVLAKSRGAEVAQAIQLTMEYDPAPPFDAGSPDKAGPDVVRAARALMDQFGESLRFRA